MADIDKTVFVSHSHEDDAEVGKLKDLLAKQGFNIRDYSVTKDNPNNACNEDYIKQEILKPRLDACSTLAVVVTPETKNSDWVNWEVSYAVQQGKNIVGIWANGCKGENLPKSLDDYAKAFVVGWDSQSIIDAISTPNSKYAYDSDGSIYSSRSDFKRHGC